MTRLTLLTLFLVACEPSAKDTADTADTGDTADTDTDSGETAEDSGEETGEDSGEDSGDETGDTGEDVAFTAVLTTVASDYMSGAVATVSDQGTVSDSVLPSGSDAVVVAQDGVTYILTRSSEDTVQVFDGVDFSAPTAEFNTGSGSNPQDIAECGGNLFVTLFSEDYVGVWDPSGKMVGTVDLSTFSDEDGSPEASAMVLGEDGFLYVALQQLDYVSTYASLDGSGTLVRIDCETMAVTESWDIGPNPRVTEGPDGTLVLYGGDYYLPDYSGPKLDGGLWGFDPATDTLSDAIVTEEELGANIGNVAVSGGKAFFTLDDGLTWEAWCLDLDDPAPTLAAEPHAFIGDAVTAPDGTVWAVQRQDYLGSADPVVGAVAYDLESCAVAATYTTSLPPYSVAFVE